MNHALPYLLDTDMCIYLLNGYPAGKGTIIVGRRYFL